MPREELVVVSDDMGSGYMKNIIGFPTTAEEIADPIEAALSHVLDHLTRQVSGRLLELYKQQAKDIRVSFLPVEKEENVWNWRIKLRAVIEWEES